jgi:hypothetical protein
MTLRKRGQEVSRKGLEMREEPSFTRPSFPCADLHIHVSSEDGSRFTNGRNWTIYIDCAFLALHFSLKTCVL